MKTLSVRSGLFWTIYSCILFAFLSACQTNALAPRERLYLHQNWQFTQSGKADWLPATVPGVVHADLLANDKIPHPWMGTNELQVQWIENENWEYKTLFQLSAQQLAFENIDLVFDGLDTYAEVVVNGVPVLQADNMFRTWRKSVSSQLKEGTNELKVIFRSPINEHKKALEALPYQLPASSENAPAKVSPYVRKAPYHFGWDWGPRLVTSGIWKSVYLDFYHELRLDNVQVLTKSIDSTEAKVSLIITLDGAKSSTDFDVFIDGQKYNYQKRAEGIYQVDYTIANPKLWWPNGWGEANLYQANIALYQHGKEVDDLDVQYGIRTVELVHQPDTVGTAFYFKINGQPIFIKGANYIPQSHFLPLVKDEQYRDLLTRGQRANINMLRVWGGGIYEQDLFYNLCDSLGILVWQDFMFANTMYPGNEAFISNVKAEIHDNVTRLRNHPSIIHWNGNNEIEVAWKNWGWQKQFGYSTTDSSQLWNDYINLFQQQIPSWLETLDSTRSYTSTSPLSNWGKPENFNHATMHYWGVWHGDEPFENYKINVGRFMSEYGFQSFPNIETIQYFAEAKDMNLDSEVMRHHQKSYKGNKAISLQTDRYWGKAKSFPEFVKQSQMAQNLAMQTAIDAHRLAKGHCWGTVFWQLNDCWPGPSWSAIDVFGNNKIFMNELPMLYAPVAMIPKINNGVLELWLVNDLLEDFEGEFVIEYVNSSGRTTTETLPVHIIQNAVLKWKIYQGVKEMKIQRFENGALVFVRLWRAD